MKRWKVCLGLFLLFVAGLVVGSVLTLGVIKHRMTEIAEGGPPAVRASIMKRLDRSLKLDQKQYSASEEIVRNAQLEIHAVRSRTQPEVEQILEDNFARMKEILNPEQQKILDEHRQRFQKRFERIRNWIANEKGGVPALGK